MPGSYQSTVRPTMMAIGASITMRTNFPSPVETACPMRDVRRSTANASTAISATTQATAPGSRTGSNKARLTAMNVSVSRRAWGRTNVSIESHVSGINVITPRPVSHTAVRGESTFQGAFPVRVASRGNCD